MKTDAPVKRGPLVALHRTDRARLAVWNGWDLVQEFDGVQAELGRARSCVAITDLSHVPKFEVIGRGVDSFCVGTLGPGSNESTQPGHVWSGGLGEANGPHSWSAIQWARLTGDHAIGGWFSAESPGSTDLSQFGRGSVSEPHHLSEATGRFAVLELLGPLGPDVLRKLTALDLACHLGTSGRCAETGVARIPAMLIRPAVAGPDRIQLWCSREYGQYLWETMLEAAVGLGGGPMGWGAWRQIL